MTDLLLRLLWFYLVGLWVGAVWLKVAWLLCIFPFTLPLGIWMIHRAPRIMTLKEEGQLKHVEVGGRLAYYMDEVEQPSLLVRVLWFVLVGWWASFCWIWLSLGISATFVGLPLGFWMVNRLPWVISLHRG